jgi:hypothetical protein
MKLTLNVTDRLAIPAFIPREGGLTEQLIGKGIVDKTMLSKEEQSKLTEDKFYRGTIDPATNFSREFDFTEAEFQVMYGQYRKLDDERKINQSNIGLAIKLVDCKSEQR